MPTLSVNGKTADIPEGTRLVLAIEASGVAIGHRCGGHARCTTCRVRFSAGEPATYTRAEFAKLGLGNAASAPDYRLACQIVCDHDMELEALMTLDNQSWSDTGPEPAAAVEPEAVWHTRAELETGA